jgi:hypothetical protein
VAWDWDVADLKRPRLLESNRPQDGREIVIVRGDDVSCEDYKGMTAEVVMECFDSLMLHYRLLCSEYNLNACEVADLAQLGKTSREILQIAGVRDGQPYRGQKPPRY